MCSASDVMPRVMRWSLSVIGSSTVPGFEALKWVTLTSACISHSFENSYPSLAYPPYCSNAEFSLWPSVRLYDPLTTLVSPFQRMRFVTSLWNDPYEPEPMLALVRMPSSDVLRVTMLITPPMALEPYSTDAGPLRTSTRSAMNDWQASAIG